MNNLITPVAPWNSDNENQPFVKEKVKAAAHQIFMQIATGRYSFGARLDAERNLADELGIHAYNDPAGFRFSRAL